MRQRKLGSHTPPCHRRMVIGGCTGGGGIQRRKCKNLQRVRMLCVWLLPGRGVIRTVAAVARVAAHSAPVLKTAVLTPPAALDRWEASPPHRIPLNTGRALLSICPSTGGGARCCRCVWCLRVHFCLGGKTDETSTRSAGIGGGAGY